jgi:hypothetical protein
MNLLLILSGLAWLFGIVLIFSTLKISGACSAEEQWQTDKRLFEKWQKDSVQAAQLASAGNQP